MSNEHLYARVTDELRTSGPIPGLWAKAFAESDGIEHKARALYLRYRVDQLAHAESVALRARQAEILATKEREENERLARAKTEGFTAIHGVLLGLIVLFFVLFFLRVLQA